MNLFAKLSALHEAGSPVCIGLIGAGKFGSMFLAQALKIPALHIAAIADLSPDMARANLALIGWQKEAYSAVSLDSACVQKTTFITDDSASLIADNRIEIIIEATGDPLAAVDHIMSALNAGKHVINVTVEADAFCALHLPVMLKNVAVCILWLTEISPLWYVILLIGHGHVVFQLWQLAAGINGCPITVSPHQRPYGTIGD